VIGRVNKTERRTRRGDDIAQHRYASPRIASAPRFAAALLHRAARI